MFILDYENIIQISHWNRGKSPRMHARFNFFNCKMPEWPGKIMALWMIYAICIDISVILWRPCSFIVEGRNWYRNTCLNRIFLGLTFMFGMDRWSIYM